MPAREALGLEQALERVQVDLAQRRQRGDGGRRRPGAAAALSFARGFVRRPDDRRCFDSSSQRRVRHRVEELAGELGELGGGSGRGGREEGKGKKWAEEDEVERETKGELRFRSPCEPMLSHQLRRLPGLPLALLREHGHVARALDPPLGVPRRLAVADEHEAADGASASLVRTVDRRSRCCLGLCGDACGDAPPRSPE